MVDVPKSLSDVDAAWMTAALRDAGHDAPDVTALSYEPMPGIVGTLGEVGIFSLTYATVTDLPTELVGKCPLDHDAARLYNSVMRYYRRETGFYRDLAGDVPMRVPRCWVSLSEDERHLLLLEYFADATPGDLLAGTSFEKMKALIGDMAALHGQYWMDERVRNLDWMFTFTEPSLLMGFDVVAYAWPIVMEQEPDAVPADLRALVEGPYLVDVPRERWIEAYDARPWTLVHGDYELDNMLFLDGDEVAVIDWQGVMVGFPAMDLGFTLAVSASDATVGRERELLDHYRAVLAGRGGPDWSHEDLMEDLAWSMLFFTAGQVIPYVQDYTNLGAHADRMKQRMATLFHRCVAAADRWDTAGRVVPPA